MDNVGAIILAGGLSRRMGSHNKLLLPINGVPMIRHMVTSYLAAVSGEVCVVTGFEPPRIRAALNTLPVRFIHNAAFEKGQPFSVQAGLRAAPTCEHLLIGLGDQPHLTTDDLRALVTAHLCSNSAKISIPYYNSTRGNPIIIPSAMHAELLADNANPGCGKFTRTHPSLVQHIPLSQPGFYRDIDTVDDAAALAHAMSEGVAS